MFLLTHWGGSRGIPSEALRTQSPQSLTRYLGSSKLVKEAAGGADNLPDGKQREM